MNTIKSNLFHFKKFSVSQENCPMKVNTDGILLGAWTDVEGAKAGLDIGTGTGVIGLMMAQKNPNLTIQCIEIDEKSYHTSKENFENSIFGGQLMAVNQSIQDFCKESNVKFDKIVSNPPFFTGGTFTNNENKLHVRHTTKLPHADLLFAVQKLLNNDGSFDLILPYIEGLRFVQMAEKYALFLQAMTEVKPREDKPTERLLMKFGRTPCNTIEKGSLVIQNGLEPNDYTPEFVSLTKDFYNFL